MAERVVITGVGVISPIGAGKVAFWEACLKGRSGIQKIAAFDVSGYKSRIAGQVAEPGDAPLRSAEQGRRLERFTQFGLAAATMAMADAGLDAAALDVGRTGVSCGSGLGGMAIGEAQLRVLYETGVPGRGSPGRVPGIMPHALSGQLASRLGVKEIGRASCRERV